MKKTSMWSAPLRYSLTEPRDDEALARVRREVLTRVSVRTVRSDAASSWLARAFTSHPFRALAFVVSLAVLGGGFVWFVQHGSASGGRLSTLSGAEFTRIDGKKGGESVTFEDGSRLEVERGASVVSLASTGTEFAVLLEKGHLDVEVTPGGPRRWIVEAKWARIEVVGTRFSVDRDRERVVVQVREGVVVVRGASLPEGVARVTAGQSVEVRERAEGSSERVARPGPGPERATDHSGEIHDQSAAPREIEHKTSAPEDSSTKAQAERRLDVETPDRLFERADEARARGDWAAAESLLERLVRVHATHPRAALAAYTLGVVRVRRSDMGAAVDAFEHVLRLAPSRSLREDALLRLVETEFARGAGERADERAREYRAWFPGGRHIGAKIGRASCRERG